MLSDVELAAKVICCNLGFGRGRHLMQVCGRGIHEEKLDNETIGGVEHGGELGRARWRWKCGINSDVGEN